MQGARAKAFNSTRLPLVGPLLSAAPTVVICLCIVLHYLARVRVMTLVEVVLRRVFMGVVHAEADAIPREMRTFPRGGGFPCLHLLAVSAGHGVDVACFNAFFTTALPRVVRGAVLVQAPASASMVPSAGVRVVDTGVSGGIAASVAGRVGEVAAVCRDRVVAGATGRRSSAGGAASARS